jgi:hypothetical protein
MPQPLQPLPQLQELPHPHFPEQQDIFGSSLRLDDRRWRWKLGSASWLLAGLRNYGNATMAIYRPEEEEEIGRSR